MQLGVNLAFDEISDSEHSLGEFLPNEFKKYNVESNVKLSMFQMMMIRPHVFHTRIQAFPFEQKEFLPHFIWFSKIYIFSIQLYFNQFSNK